MTGADQRHIAGQRRCVSCDYNLHGLPIGGRCPECGTPIRTDQQLDDVLSQMPLFVIRQFSIASIIAAGCVLLAVVAHFGMTINAFPKWLGPGVLAGLSGIWVLSVFALTPAMSVPAAIKRGFKRGGLMRHTTRVLQFGWILAAGCIFTGEIYKIGPKGQDWLAAGLLVGTIIGLVGLVFLCIMLERLAEWARDDSAESLFNWATWGIPIVSGFRLLDLPLPFVDLFLFIGWLVMMMAFPLAMIMLSRSVTLSILHAIDYSNIDVRRFERQKQYDQRVTETVQRADEVEQRTAEQRQHDRREMLGRIHEQRGGVKPHRPPPTPQVQNEPGQGNTGKATKQ